VIGLFGLAPARVVAIPLAASDVFYPPARFSLDGPLLYAGDDGPRKNVATIRQAAAELGLPLVETAASSPDDPRLRELYGQCSVFLYPSLYEGFGLPVLEAMQCGAPVIVSRDPALRETAGGAAMAVEATDVRAWKEAILAVRGSQAYWRERSLARAALFSWRRTARLTRETYLAARSRHFA
jgi:glycosyltransferase involved in cell wall biosynthesis